MLFLIETKLTKERMLVTRQLLGFNNGIAVDRQGKGGGSAFVVVGLD